VGVLELAIEGTAVRTVLQSVVLRMLLDLRSLPRFLPLLESILFRVVVWLLLVAGGLNHRQLRAWLPCLQSNQQKGSVNKTSGDPVREKGRIG
jgi:hypothetical protein